MAQKIRIALILLLCLSAAAIAVSKSDIKKFPPVSGEIYGQAAPGVRSISINGKPVSFDAGQNFRALVNLKAGEKYLILRINYENLRIIKKYLIVRREKVKFKVYVPKEKIEKAIKAAKPSREELLRQKREKLLASIKREKEREKLLKEIRALEEKRWVEKVASPRFYAKEFKPGTTVESLAVAIYADAYGLPFKTRAGTIERLNELLTIPNFYDIVQAKGKTIPPDRKLKDLIAETQSFRYRPFSQLSDFQQKKIMLLNRLLLEAIYPDAPKRKSWLAAAEKPAPAPTTVAKVCEYLYVWEFSEGKLLAVREKQGKYSADIYIPVSKQWLDLRGLSEKDLQDLIRKPIQSFKPKKK